MSANSHAETAALRDAIAACTTASRQASDELTCIDQAHTYLTQALEEAAQAEPDAQRITRLRTLAMQTLQLFDRWNTPGSKA